MIWQFKEVYLVGMDQAEDQEPTEGVVDVPRPEE